MVSLGVLFGADISFTRKVKKMLEKAEIKDWYNEDCGCYETHKSKQNIYYGYWSFEAGAIAKILNLDDSRLKDVPYYPYDLVHYKKNLLGLCFRITNNLKTRAHLFEDKEQVAILEKVFPRIAE